MGAYAWIIKIITLLKIPMVKTTKSWNFIYKKKLLNHTNNRYLGKLPNRVQKLIRIL